MAKQYAQDADIDVFLNDLPHRYFEENQLHAFILSGMKDYAQCLRELNRFLPCVDNWATCDQMSPKVFRKHRKELPDSIREWIGSGETYTIRLIKAAEGYAVVVAHVAQHRQVEDQPVRDAARAQHGGQTAQLFDRAA